MNKIVKEYYEQSEGEVELSWEDVEQSAYAIIRQMHADAFEPDVIISIARSGLIPASLISYALGNKELYVIKIDFSKSQKISHQQDMRDLPKITQALEKDVEGLKVLVVDEMVVSGSTLKMVSDYMGMKHPREVKYAVLYKQPWSQFSPDYFGQEVREWPIFPWKRLKHDES
jgi:hypoxanthine phosphoribosyltransferase